MFETWGRTFRPEALGCFALLLGNLTWDWVVCIFKCSWSTFNIRMFNVQHLCPAKWDREWQRNNWTWWESSQGCCCTWEFVRRASLYNQPDLSFPLVSRGWLVYMCKEMPTLCIFYSEEPGKHICCSPANSHQQHDTQLIMIMDLK